MKFDMRTIAWLLSAIAISSACGISVAWAEGYLCVADKSAGFKYRTDVQNWDQTFFSPDGKYVIRKPNAAEIKAGEYKWIITKMGSQETTASCRKEINEFGYLFCTGIGSEFRFNDKSMRFITAYLFGFYNSGMPGHPDADSDTPFIEIGRCSKI